MKKSYAYTKAVASRGYSFWKQLLLLAFLHYRTKSFLFLKSFFPGFICKTPSGAGKDNLRKASLSCVINLRVYAGFCTFMGKKHS